MESNFNRVITPLYPDMQTSGNRLRVGIVLEKMNNPAWINRIVSDIVSSKFCHTVFIILNYEDNYQKKRTVESPIQYIRAGYHRINTMLYRWYVNYDKKKHPGLMSAIKEKSTDGILESDIIYVNAKKNIRFNSIDIPDTSNIRSHNLDVILKLGFNEQLTGDILSCVKHGIWFYHFGESEEYYNYSSFFWPIYKRRSTLPSCLKQQLPCSNNNEIYCSYSATQNGLWESQNCEESYWKASSFVIRCLRRLYLKDLQPNQPTDKLTVEQKVTWRLPSNLEVLRFIGRSAFGVIKEKFSRQYRKEQWFLAYRAQQRSTELVPGLTGFIPIYPPKERFYADPFLIRVNDKDYLFFEDYLFGSRKGEISFVVFDENNTPSEPRLALSYHCHLSYPFLFEWDGNIYMIPETSECRAIKLFRANSFPDQWEYVCDLLNDVCAVDTTLYEYQGRWYMFTNISECGGSTNDELFLFFAETPLGPWAPHPKNPVKSDARSARPAGNIIQLNGKIIRPSQDCTVTYGHEIQFNEITVLTTTDYQEKMLGKVSCNWFKHLTGTHTYNSNGHLEVIDGKKYIWKKSSKLNSLSKVLDKLKINDPNA